MPSRPGGRLLAALLLGLGAATTSVAAGRDATLAGWQVETQAVAGSLRAEVWIGPDDAGRGEQGPRRLRVFDADRLALESETAIPCKGCGGSLGDPFKGLDWQGQTLLVSLEGGSREQWFERWRFAGREGRWLVAGWDRGLRDRANGDVWQESVNALTGRATARFDPGRPGGRRARRASCAEARHKPGLDQIEALRAAPYACGLKVEPGE